MRNEHVQQRFEDPELHANWRVLRALLDDIRRIEKGVEKEEALREKYAQAKAAKAAFDIQVRELLAKRQKLPEAMLLSYMRLEAMLQKVGAVLEEVDSLTEGDIDQLLEQFMIDTGEAIVPLPESAAIPAEVFAPLLSPAADTIADSIEEDPGRTVHDLRPAGAQAQEHVSDEDDDVALAGVA